MAGVIAILYLGATATAVSFLVITVLRSKRRLDDRVEQFLLERDEASGPIDPYAQMASIHTDSVTTQQSAETKKGG